MQEWRWQNRRTDDKDEIGGFEEVVESFRRARHCDSLDVGLIVEVSAYVWVGVAFRWVNVGIAMLTTIEYDLGQYLWLTTMSMIIYRQLGPLVDMELCL